MRKKNPLQRSILQNIRDNNLIQSHRTQRTQKILNYFSRNFCALCGKKFIANLLEFLISLTTSLIIRFTSCYPRFYLGNIARR